MSRIRLYDCRYSRLPSVIGACQGDSATIAGYVNSAQRRLLLCREAGDEGWWGTWAEVVFKPVSRLNPYITLPREIARIEKMSVCNHPISVNNQFFEYLRYGNGRLPQMCCRNTDHWAWAQAVTRNDAVTFSDLVNPPKIIRVYASNPADADGQHRVFLQGEDQNGVTIYTQDNSNQVMGTFVTLDTPFADSPYQFSTLTGIQKDVTVGNVQFFQVDPSTGVESLMLTMEPGEQVAGYRRYYLNDLPPNCCNWTGPVLPLFVTAIVKLEMIPVAVDTDYLLFHNLEAIIEECSSVRYSEMDNETAKAMAADRHTQAIRFLQGELVHYLGKLSPAVRFSPFGSASLERQKIGLQI